MHLKSWLAAPFCVAALLGLSMGPAQAQGQTERGPEHANSICSFSGLNDDPEQAFPEGGRVQSYGQLVKKGLKEFIPSPGSYCNAHLYPYPPGPPPPDENGEH